MSSRGSLKKLRFDIISIFPNIFDSLINESILKRARDQSIVDVRVHNLRDYSVDKHMKVDDHPFGGGVGMVMSVEPIARAIETVKQGRPNVHTLLMSPSGKRFDQAKACQLSRVENIIIICGRYEGVDERVGRFYVDEEISIGVYVLSGGEIPAMVLLESVARLVPGVLGDENSIVEESFSWPMLEYPQYTRPRDFRGFKAPEILVSGNHEKIRNWHREQALKKTAKLRPDLLKNQNAG